jgi:hypothetical protein
MVLEIVRSGSRLPNRAAIVPRKIPLRERQRRRGVQHDRSEHRTPECVRRQAGIRKNAESVRDREGAAREARPSAMLSAPCYDSDMLGIGFAPA